MMRILDLFSGIGGFSLGLERAGMKTVAFCEIDPFCRRVLAKHWPDVPCHHDITKLEGDHVGPVDVVCGGFPCQDISSAGQRAGINGARSGLWFEYARLIGELRPRYVIVENVAGLLARGMGDVLGELATLGYDAEWHCIPAAAVGAPHRRDRVWIVGYPNADSQPAGAQHAEMAIMRGSLSDAISHQLWQQSRRRHGANGACAAQPGQHGQIGHVADASGIRRSDDCPTTGSEGAPIIQGRLLQSPRDGQWNAESCMGEPANGIPTELDGGRLNADAEEIRPETPLCAVQPAANQEAVRQQDGRSECVSKAAVLRSQMHGDGLCQRCSLKLRAAETGDEIPWQDLRELWGYGEARGASRRRQSIERLLQQYPDLMRLLSYRAPPPCTACWLDGSWEDGLPRVANWVPSRTHRLRALGNAVVPQIPELIGRAIMDLEMAKPE